YRAVRLVPAERWQLDLREALCLWVEGDPVAAADALAALDRTGDQPLVKYYLAAVLEQIGRYPEAQSALAGAKADTGPTADLIRHLRIRLEAR
ncbi:MAG TPA: tetratricopeptide repeat protein, partial [Phycisphaerae bacterium]|nr:tetratricopeptide repeat protein [Phycisphaerae bacterium]